MLRAFIEAPAYEASLAHQVAVAPPEIAADVAALADWLRTEAPEAMRAHDYDVRRLILDGTPEERAAFNRNEPAIADQHGRVMAYEAQICGS